MKKTADYVWKPDVIKTPKKVVEPKVDEAKELVKEALRVLHGLSGDAKRATIKAIEALEKALAL